jgi:hypothetical protein
MQFDRRNVLAGMLIAASSQLGPDTASPQTASPHVALLGDSVFDNSAYVAGGPDVVAQLRAISPPGWRATLLAIDGAVIAGVEGQLARLPRDATHLVVSAGGNDALGQSSVLDLRLRSMAEALGTLRAVQAAFRTNYARMLDAVAARKLRVAVCSIYDPRYPERERRELGATALTVLNDIISREAFRRSLTLIDLRVLMNDDADFANPIEPSEQGGMKLAKAIKQFVQGEATARVIA